MARRKRHSEKEEEPEMASPLFGGKGGKRGGRKRHRGGKRKGGRY